MPSYSSNRDQESWEIVAIALGSAPNPIVAKLVVVNTFKITIDSARHSGHTILERVQNRGCPMVTLEETTVINAPLERCFDLARSVEVHLAGNVNSGEAALAVGGVTSGLIAMGQRVTWRAKHLGVWQNLTSQITALQRPDYFQDSMIRGAFKSMKHEHYFRSLSAQQTEMRDVFCFAAPLGILGRIAESLVLHRYMQALLHDRNITLKKIS